MTHYEAIIGTEYRDEQDVEKAVAEAMYHLSPLHMARPPIDVNIYGDGVLNSQLAVGVVFETDASVEQIEDCGAESVEEVAIEIVQ
jgi:hypothetical protein